MTALHFDENGDVEISVTPKTIPSPLRYTCACCQWEKSIDYWRDIRDKKIGYYGQDIVCDACSYDKPAHPPGMTRRDRLIVGRINGAIEELKGRARNAKYEC